MDPLLRAQGLTRGTVGERMTALGKDPKHLFPNTDAGRAADPRLSERPRRRHPRPGCRAPSRTLVKGNLVIKRVPPEIEAGAPGGYAAAGTIDGSVPGNYYINLRDTAHLAALLPADPHLSRGHSGPYLAGRIYATSCR